MVGGMYNKVAMLIAWLISFLQSTAEAPLWGAFVI